MMGKKLGVKDYRDPKVQAEFTDAQAAQLITDGKDKMKAFKGKLSDRRNQGPGRLRSGIQEITIHANGAEQRNAVRAGPRPAKIALVAWIMFSTRNRRTD